MSTNTTKRATLLPLSKLFGAHAEQTWPALFNRESPVPLAIGIHRQIYAAMPQLTRKEKQAVRVFLRWWCSRRKYHRAMRAAQSVYRVNLDGSLSGQIVDEREKEFAAGELMRIEAMSPEVANA